MTAPMSGQSPAKKTELGRWRTEQLERRPPPAAATGVIDWAVANGDIDTIVANNTVSSIPYDSVDIAPDSTHFRVGTASPTIKPIEIFRDGWYMIYVEAWPAGVGNPGDYGVGIDQSGAGLFYNFSYSAGGLFARRIRYIKSSTVLWGFQETFGPVYCVAKNQCRVGASVYHYLDTPGTIDWNYGMLAIVALGDALGLTNTAAGSWRPDGFNSDEQFRTYL